jgi:hypothetical protein
MKARPARVLLLSVLLELSRCRRSSFVLECCWVVLVQIRKVVLLLGCFGVASGSLFSRQCIFFWEWTCEVGMESRFFMEAKAFSLSVEKGKLEFSVEERRKGLLGVVFLGTWCVAWLIVMVEKVLRFTGDEDFVKYTQEASIFLTVWRGGNMDGFF